jgi:hypothetical protein
MTINAGALGTVLVEAQILPLQKSEPQIEVQV